MPTRYSDIIKLQDFLPVYDILDENPNAWKQFIPTRQFCELLKKSLTCFTSNDVSVRKSIWVRGTFGTGKSHASAVVKHLLCDDKETITSYINNIEDIALKQEINNLRDKKRFFSVTLKGVENAYDIPHFSLALQRETQKALSKVAPDIVVKSDFQTAVEWIENHRDTFESIILAKDDDLCNVVDNVEQVLLRLKAFDSSVFTLVESALTRLLGPVLQHSNISEWLVEIGKVIEERGLGNGIIIFWDEFTSVMDTLKSDRINVLQNIAEKSQKNNVFLFLISHRLESQMSDNRGKDISKMSNRFEDIPYTMDSISTYLIMRHSLTIPDLFKNEYENKRNKACENLCDVIDFLCEYNKESKHHIKRLFPLHPFTAYLCSVISNIIGSSNRSVIKFIHDKELGLPVFLNDTLAYEEDKLLTADVLWDFFMPDFDKDAKCTAFISVYNAYIDKVLLNGNDYAKVFKVILLLNAIAPNNRNYEAKNEELKPNEKVICYIFSGNIQPGKIKNILDFLNGNNIVNKNIFDEFKITASSFNQSALNNEKAKLQTSFSTSMDVINYDTESKNELEGLFVIGEKVKRETDVLFLSCEYQEHQMKSYLNKFTSSKPNYIHVVMLTSLSEDERDQKRLIIKNLSIEYKNVVFIVIEESFSKDYYSKFIDALATSKIAEQQFNKVESDEYIKHAHKFVEKWVSRALGGAYSMYFNDLIIADGVLSQVNDVLNKKISPKIFSKGFECVKKYQSTTNTFFVDKNCPKVILQILEATNREKLIKHTGSAMPIAYIFEEDGNSLITMDGSLSENAKLSGAWIAEVCGKMDDCMKKARKKYEDRFSLADVLAPFVEPPYGFFTSYANCAALAYALRSHKQDLFLPGISQPVSDDKLTDYLVDIFKMWVTGKNDKITNKWLLRFGSPEESKLTELLVYIFDLNKKSQNIKSLDNAKWYIQDFCKNTVMQPLWVLTYANISDDLKNAVRNLAKLFDAETMPVSKIKEVFKLLSLNKQELNIVLTNKQNYDSGFINFVESIEEAEIKKEWWDEMLSAVAGLQDEIAFRKEETVRQTIVKFYINKLKPKNEDDEPIPYKIDNDGQSSPASFVAESIIDDVKAAKEIVQKANMPNMMWRKLIIDLIDAHPEISEFWIRNFK